MGEISSINKSYIEAYAIVNNFQNRTKNINNKNKPTFESGKIVMSLAALAVLGGAIVFGVMKHKNAEIFKTKKILSHAKADLTPKKLNQKEQINSLLHIQNKPLQPVQNSPKQIIIESYKLNIENIGDKTSKKNRLKAIKFFSEDEDFYTERPFLFYGKLKENFYEEIRSPKQPYVLRKSCIKNIATITASDANDVKAFSKNGWHYRQYTGGRNGVIVDRISLNVYPEEELIQKLDNLVTKSKGTVEYKTPDFLDSWNIRHDPITIYFTKPVTPDIENEIVQIVSPHIRKTGDEVLIGRKIFESIYQVKEPDENEVAALVQRAADIKLDDKLVEYLLSPNKSALFGGAHLFSEKNGIKHVHTSPGVIAALHKMLNELEKIK